MIKLIIVNGRAKSGKDTFIGFVSERFKSLDIKHTIVSSIDPVKDAMKTHFNWDGSKNIKSRTFMSKIKDAWVEFDNGPFKFISNRIKENEILITQIREPSEIFKLKKKFGKECLTIFINNKNNITDEEKEILNKWDIENFYYDIYIENDTTVEQFKKESLNILKKVFEDGL